MASDAKDVLAFAADTDAKKRDKLVDRLLETPEYAYYFANKWADILRVKRRQLPDRATGTFAFHDWIRQALAENRPYDQFVAEIVTARGDAAFHPPVVWYRQVKELEEQVDDTAQLFLGLRLQCARCHQHPYERWGPGDYDGFAAFFRRIGRKPGLDPITLNVVYNLIRKLNDALGATSVVVTYDVHEAVKLADYLYLLNDGVIVAHGATAEMVESKDPFVHQFLHAEADGPVRFHFPAPPIAVQLELAPPTP